MLNVHEFYWQATWRQFSLSRRSEPSFNKIGRGSSSDLQNEFSLRTFTNCNVHWTPFRFHFSQVSQFSQYRIFKNKSVKKSERIHEKIFKNNIYTFLYCACKEKGKDLSLPVSWIHFRFKNPLKSFEAKCNYPFVRWCRYWRSRSLQLKVKDQDTEFDSNGEKWFPVLGCSFGQ